MRKKSDQQEPCFVLPATLLATVPARPKVDFAGRHTLFLVSNTARKNQEQSLTPSLVDTIPGDTIPGQNKV